MKDTFHMGYDLGEAGFNFMPLEKQNNFNTELLNGIAEDFINVSKQKSGKICNKGEILNRFYDAAIRPTTEEPILIIYLNSAHGIMLKFINRSNPLFNRLFTD
ncbi:hypothetical protein ACVWYG_001228 [Pedobacter sp. UYEF25]